MMSIEQLPNECLAMIFDKFLLLKNLMRLELVCKHWKTVLEEVVFPRRTSLKLYSRNYHFQPSNSLTFLEFNEHFFYDALCVDKIEKSTCLLLIRKFRLIEFHVYGCKTDLQSLLSLLSTWSDRLEKLIFIGSIINSFEYSKKQVECPRYEQIIATLVSISSLRHLYCNTFLCSQLLTLLSQLETFYYETNRMESPGVYDVLSNLGPHISSLHLLFKKDSSLSSPRVLNAFDQIPFSTISKQLIRLSFCTIDCSSLQFICDNFESLTHLDVSLECNMTFEKMTPQLCKLKQLTNLRLTNPTDTTTFFPFYKMSSRNFRRRLKPLESVKTLELNLELKLIRLNYIDHMFPNLHKLVFSQRLFRCECLFYSEHICRRCSDAIFKRLISLQSHPKIYYGTYLLFDCSQNDTEFLLPDMLIDQLFI